MNKRYGGIDGLRAFAAIGIVMMHVKENAEYEIPGFIGERMIPSFTDFVFLFMTVSAFGLCCGYYERFQAGTINLDDFYRKRFMRILPFFAFLSVVDVVISPSLSSLYELFANVTLMFGLLPNADITVIGVGWFLGVIFAFYFLFPFFMVVMKNKRRAWMAMGVAVVLNVLCSVYFFNDAHVVEGFRAKSNIVYCFIYLTAGGLIYLYRDKIEKLNVYLVSAMALLSVCAYYLIDANAFTCLVVSAAFLMLAITTSKPSKSILGGVLENRVTAFLSGISMEIYLCHMVFYRVFEKFGLIHFIENELVAYIIIFFMVFLAALVFSVISKKMSGIFLEKRVLRDSVKN